MKIKSFVAALGAAALTFAPAPALAENLRIGVEGAYPPFSAVDEKGALIGFDIEIANALCEEMGATCELVQQDWDGIIPGLLERKFDAIVASMTATEERKEKVDFTERYYKDGAKFVRAKSATGRVSYGGLGGKKVGVQRGTVTDTFLSAEFEGVDVKRYDTLENAQQDLLTGRLDLLLADQFVQDEFVKANTDYEAVGATYTNSKYFGDIAIAVRPGDDALRQKINAAIKAIRANGKYGEINDSYFSHDIYGR